MGELLAQTRPEARVAFLNDYPSRWSVQWQKHHADFDWVKHFTHYYRPFARANLGVDVVHADTPLDNYRIVVMPALIIGSALAGAVQVLVPRSALLAIGSNPALSIVAITVTYWTSARQRRKHGAAD